MAFGLAGGLSKPDWCRLELYGWPWHSALVSEHCIGRGVDCWGSEIWTIAFADAENKYNVFRLMRLSCRTGKHVLDIGVFKKDGFSLSDLLTLSGFEIKPRSLHFPGPIFDNKSLPFGHSRRVWRWDKKKNGSGLDGCFTSFDVAMGNYQLAYC